MNGFRVIQIDSVCRCCMSRIGFSGSQPPRLRQPLERASATAGPVRPMLAQSCKDRRFPVSKGILFNVVQSLIFIVFAWRVCVAWVNMVHIVVRKVLRDCRRLASELHPPPSPEWRYACVMVSCRSRSQDRTFHGSLVERYIVVLLEYICLAPKSVA